MGPLRGPPTWPTSASSSGSSTRSTPSHRPSPTSRTSTHPHCAPSLAMPSPHTPPSLSHAPPPSPVQWPPLHLQGAACGARVGVPVRGPMWAHLPQPHPTHRVRTLPFTSQGPKICEKGAVPRLLISIETHSANPSRCTFIFFRVWCVQVCGRVQGGRQGRQVPQLPGRSRVQQPRLQEQGVHQAPGQTPSLSHTPKLVHSASQPLTLFGVLCVCRCSVRATAGGACARWRR